MSSENAPNIKQPLQLKKFRLEQCDNGWMCVISIGKDEFVTRKVFTSTGMLCQYLMREFRDNHYAEITQ